MSPHARRRSQRALSTTAAVLLTAGLATTAWQIARPATAAVTPVAAPAPAPVDQPAAVPAHAAAATRVLAAPRRHVVVHRKPAPVRTHATRPAVVHVFTPKPRPVSPHHRTAPRPAPTPYVDGPTSWSALNAAIARIPSYRNGTRWVVSSKYGSFWGTTDWYHDVIYVSPSVPTRYLYDVAVHEWSHELSVLDYAGDVSAATAAMNHVFGGAGASGLNGAENAADCMAILQGATWTHYTTCTNSSWRSAALRLVHGERL